MKALDDFELFTISRDIPKQKKELLLFRIKAFKEFPEDFLSRILYFQEELSNLTRDDINSLVLTARRIKKENAQ